MKSILSLAMLSCFFAPFAFSKTKKAAPPKTPDFYLVDDDCKLLGSHFSYDSPRPAAGSRSSLSCFRKKRLFKCTISSLEKGDGYGAQQSSEIDLIVQTETPDSLLLKSPSGNNFLFIHNTGRYSLGLTYFDSENRVVINKACVGNQLTGDQLDRLMKEKKLKGDKK